MPAQEASGQNDMAIAEFKEAISLDPKQSQVILALGSALEKKSDWVGALEQDRKAALTEASANGKHQLGEAFYLQYGGPERIQSGSTAPSLITLLRLRRRESLPKRQNWKSAFARWRVPQERCKKCS